MSKVREILQGRQLQWVQESQTVAEVVQRMAELTVGAILVVKDRELRGVFSERDLMTRVVLTGLDPSSTPVGSVMSTDLATLEETSSLEQAMESMRAHNCRHLPVMRAGQVIGFLSMRDLMIYELARKTEELIHMRAYIHGTA